MARSTDRAPEREPALKKTQARVARTKVTAICHRTARGRSSRIRSDWRHRARSLAVRPPAT